MTTAVEEKEQDDCELWEVVALGTVVRAGLSEELILNIGPWGDVGSGEEHLR